MSTSAYTLGNGEERHTHHPETFQIPNRMERENVPIGGHVNLMFNAPFGMTERMWVIVNGRIDGGRYTGFLVKNPAVISAKRGDSVEFGPEHVINILTPEHERLTVVARRHDQEPCVETD
jgi:hypothetical protein